MQGWLGIKIAYRFGRKMGQSFRKTLPLDYKKGNRHSHRNTHAIPLVQKDKLLKSMKGGDWKRIRELERQSLKPFGRFTRTGFVFDKEKLPFYDIPDLTNFELKPYVNFNAPKIPVELRTHQRDINAKKMEAMNASQVATRP